MLRLPDTWVRGLAVLTTVGMFVVLVMGATVTNTGSAEGCGRSWPLCNGQFIPEFTVATAIEFSHRAVTGLESLLVVAVSLAMLAWWRDRESVVLVALMMGTLLLQAGLGAVATDAGDTLRRVAGVLCRDFSQCGSGVRAHAKHPRNAPPPPSLHPEYGP